MNTDPVLSAQLADGATPETVTRAMRPWLDHKDGVAIDRRIYAIARETASNGRDATVQAKETAIVSTMREAWNDAQALGGSFPIDLAREMLDGLESEAKRRRVHSEARAPRTPKAAPKTPGKSTPSKARPVLIHETTGRIINYI